MFVVTYNQLRSLYLSALGVCQWLISGRSGGRQRSNQGWCFGITNRPLRTPQPRTHHFALSRFTPESKDALNSNWQFLIRWPFCPCDLLQPMSTPVVKLWRLIIFAGATLVCEACYTGKLGVVFIFARTVTLAEQSARIGFGDFFSSLASVTCRKLNDTTHHVAHMRVLRGPLHDITYTIMYADYCQHFLN